MTRALAQGSIQERANAEQGRTEREAALTIMRREIIAVGDELGDLTNLVHRDEVARTQQRLRIEALQTKALEELGIDPKVLVEDFGPHQLVPVITDIDTDSDGVSDGLAAVPYVREVQAKRLRSAERKLSTSAGSTRWRWRSMPRWRSATSS